MSIDSRTPGKPATQATTATTATTATPIDLDEVARRHLTELERRLGATDGASGLLAEMADYHLGTGGKRLRALIPVWVCANLGGDPAAALDVGAGLELLHNATLVHDDLQDGDLTRRGVPTVWKRWGAAQAINCGDGMYFLGLSRLLRSPAGQACAALASAALVRVIEGQAMEFQLQRPADDPAHLAPSLAAYERMARGKTAALFGACTGCGALAAGADEATVHAVRELGEDVGLLFQVQDDFLDLVGDKGRERPATDIAEGKLSWPVLWAYENLPAAAAKRLRAIVETPRAATKDAMIDEALGLLEAHGALAATAAWLEDGETRIAQHPWTHVAPGLAGRFLAPVAAGLEKYGRAAKAPGGRS